MKHLEEFNRYLDRLKDPQGFPGEVIFDVLNELIERNPELLKLIIARFRKESCNKLKESYAMVITDFDKSDEFVDYLVEKHGYPREEFFYD